MATAANARSEKVSTATPLKRLALSKHPAPIRTAEAVLEKYEQIQDGLEQGSLPVPVARQMDQTLKGIVGLARLHLQWLRTMQAMGRHAVVPRTPILRDMLGLPEQIGKGDGETVRKMIGVEP